ncbi:DUF2746 domain-containing protein [Actinoplanes sp. NPDC026670]|uniref:DUF2746 domain-containing protein n=1 Tax=Actinoplanes sp. NPDC026670 TaxID=3154700 RepID=UPI0033ED740C
MTNLVEILALEAPVQAAIVTTFGTIAVALIGIILELLRRNHKKLGAVKDQVQNSHSTNLRDDIDVVIAELRGLRTEVRQERSERFDYEQRTNERLTRIERSL